MFEHILDKKRLSLLKMLVKTGVLDGFYLAGGTALSLQLGLRVSEDFDFFTLRHFNADSLYDVLRKRFPSARAVVIEPDTCDILIDGAKVSFIFYPYKLVEAFVQGSGDFDRLRMASPEDIAAMKLSAIGSRGARKDFYDLYQIYRCVPDFDGKRLLSVTREKYGREKDITYMLMGLGYFDDAEQEALPKTFVPADWEEIKRFFVSEQRRLFDEEESRVRKAILEEQDFN